MRGAHEIRDHLLVTLDKAINEGEWGGSLFFKNILKRLQLIRETATNELAGLEDEDVQMEQQKAIIEDVKVKPGYQRVYITLYQTEGQFLDRWFSVIKALTQYSGSRPVYQTEDEVLELLRAKRAKTDAYVVVWVKETDVIPNNLEMVRDRYGHELLTLKEGSVKLENIAAFCYDTKRYVLRENQLLLVM